VGDLAGYYVPNNGYGGGAFSYLFGPRVNVRRGKLTPFAHVLLGGILTSTGIGELGPENHFAMTVGGGIDFTVSEHLAVRPVQAEYFMTKIPDGLNNQQNNFRFGTGIVLRPRR
jgi:opacity protein-like surface antigen